MNRIKFFFKSLQVTIISIFSQSKAEKMAIDLIDEDLKEKIEKIDIKVDEMIYNLNSRLKNIEEEINKLETYIKL